MGGNMEVLDDSGLPSLRSLNQTLGTMTMSADTKLLIAKLTATTAEVGGKIIEVGRRIMAFVFDMIRRFPNLAFGLVLGATLAALVASIPFIGALLSPMLTPLLLAFGIGKGALADLKDNALKSRIDGLETEFRKAAV